MPICQARFQRLEKISSLKRRWAPASWRWPLPWEMPAGWVFPMLGWNGRPKWAQIIGNRLIPKFPNTIPNRVRWVKSLSPFLENLNKSFKIHLVDHHADRSQMAKQDILNRSRHQIIVLCGLCGAYTSYTLGWTIYRLQAGGMFYVEDGGRMSEAFVKRSAHIFQATAETTVELHSEEFLCKGGMGFENFRDVIWCCRNFPRPATTTSGHRCGQMMLFIFVSYR